MPSKILIVQDANFSPKGWPGAEPIEANKLSDIPKKVAGATAIVIAPDRLRHDASLQGALNAGFPLTCLFFRDQAQADEYAVKLQFIVGETRATGVKDTLAKGSNIFTETFFDAGKVGERLDPCFRFARSKLTPKKAVDVWGALHAMLFLGIRSLPGQGEKGTGERVDVQVGADANLFAFTIRFDLAPELFPELRRHALLEAPRQAVDFFEFRYLQDAKKVELLGVSFFAEAGQGSVEAQSFHAAAAVEAPGSAKDYSFLPFGSMKGDNPEEKRVIKGGFKKKFSETVTIKADAPEAETVTKVSAEKIVDADGGNFLVKGEVLQPTEKVVVSGSATMGKGDKTTNLLESKIESLENTLKQREELIAKLNKEIEDIKDPMKMGVISGIKDNQLEGLKDNLTRVQGELAEAQTREKELMGVVDKAIQMKDEAIKKFKELETKLRQSQGGNNSKVIMLEKQVEEAKRQNKELSKRISQLMEQAGNKAA